MTRPKVLSVRLSKTGRDYDVIARHAKGETKVAQIYKANPECQIQGWFWWAPSASLDYYKHQRGVSLVGGPFPRRVDALDEIKRALNMRKETKP